MLGVTRLTITARPVATLGGEDADEALELTVDGPGGLEPEWLRDRLRDLLPPDGYVLTETRTTTEWGASAETIDIALAVIDAAWQGIVGAAAWELLRKVRERLGRPNDPRVWNEDEAQEAARYRVAVHYPVSSGDLSVTETTIDPSGAIVSLAANDGTRYRVTLRADGQTGFTRIERTPRAPG